MVPTAGVFRWSFRWLPLLPSRPRPLRRRSPRIILTKTTTFRRLSPTPTPTLAHNHRLDRKNWTANISFPLAWIFLGLALVWLLVESPQFNLLREWAPTAITLIALLTTFICIPTNSGVPKYNLAQSLLESTAARSASSLPQHLSHRRRHLSHGDKTRADWTNRPPRQHFDVGRLAFR